MFEFSSIFATKKNIFRYFPYQVYYRGGQKTEMCSPQKIIFCQGLQQSLAPQRCCFIKCPFYNEMRPTLKALKNCKKLSLKIVKQQSSGVSCTMDPRRVFCRKGWVTGNQEFLITFCCCFVFSHSEWGDLKKSWPG